MIRISKRELVAVCRRIDNRELAHRVSRGAGLTFGAMVARTLLTVISTAVLARLLVPSDFGRLTMATMVTELASLAANFGFYSILVQKPRVRRAELDSVAWFSLGVGILLTALVFALSFGVERVFRDP